MVKIIQTVYYSKHKNQIYCCVRLKLKLADYFFRTRHNVARSQHIAYFGHIGIEMAVFLDSRYFGAHHVIYCLNDGRVLQISFFHKVHRLNLRHKFNGVEIFKLLRDFARFAACVESKRHGIFLVCRSGYGIYGNRMGKDFHLCNKTRGGVLDYHEAAVQAGVLY